MLNVIYSGQFKKDYKRCQKRGFDIRLLQSIVAVLAIPAPLPPKNKDHALKVIYIWRRECHISPDWLLIYRIDGNELILARTLIYLAYKDITVLFQQDHRLSRASPHPSPNVTES